MGVLTTASFGQMRMATLFLTISRSEAPKRRGVRGNVTWVYRCRSEHYSKFHVTDGKDLTKAAGILCGKDALFRKPSADHSLGFPDEMACPFCCRAVCRAALSLWWCQDALYLAWLLSGS